MNPGSVADLQADAPVAGSRTAVDSTPTEPTRTRRFHVTTGLGLIADVTAVVLLWQEGPTTIATVLCLLALLAGVALLLSHPRSRRARALVAVAVIALLLVLTGTPEYVKKVVSQGASLPNVDGGTWIHVHRPAGAGFATCTTAFAVEAGTVRYMVTARSCLRHGPATITTSDDPTGRYDRYTFASGVDCAEPERRCITAGASPSAANGVLLDVAAFEPDTAEPSSRIQADANTDTVPVIGSATVADVMQRDDRYACHFGLGSAQHARQPKQCGRSIRTLPSGLGELDVYGNNDGDLGGPVYVSTPDGSAVYILGVVVDVNGACNLDGCHGQVRFVPVHDVETALGARLVTSA